MSDLDLKSLKEAARILQGNELLELRGIARPHSVLDLIYVYNLIQSVIARNGEEKRQL